MITFEQKDAASKRDAAVIVVVYLMHDWIIQYLICEY